MDYQAKIARNVAAIPRSGIRDFFELVQGRDDVISLGVGEPDFVTPWHIREAAIYSLEKGHTSYTSNLGLLPLRKSIARYVGDLFGVSYDPAREVLVTVGVSEAIDIGLRALLDPGDEVIYHAPCYVSYSPSIVMAHGVAVPVVTTKQDGFSLKPANLAAAITPKTRVIMLNFPTNPTGACASREDLEGIAKLAVQHDLIVMTDEIYSELRYDGETHVSIASLPGMQERTILLHGFSKAFAMTGFRLGYACAPQPIIEAMMKIHQYSMLCAPIMSQNAAIEALENGTPAMLEMRDAYTIAAISWSAGSTKSVSTATCRAVPSTSFRTSAAVVFPARISRCGCSSRKASPVCRAVRSALPARGSSVAVMPPLSTTSAPPPTASNASSADSEPP
jgi:aminotransferase